jgi:hypothetical protein
MGVPDYCVHPSGCPCESCAGLRSHERDVAKHAVELADLRATVARLTAERDAVAIAERHCIVGYINAGIVMGETIDSLLDDVDGGCHNDPGAKALKRAVSGGEK